MKKHILNFFLIISFLFAVEAHSQYTIAVNTSTAGIVTICSNTMVTLITNTNYTGTVSGYVWTGSTFASPIYQSSITVGPGTYTVLGTTPGPVYLGPQVVIVSPCVGVDDTEFLSERITVFPNPVKDVLYFRTEDAIIYKCNLKVTTIFGQVIYSETDFDLRTGLKLAAFKAGFVYVTLQTNYLQKTFKVVRE